MATEDIIIRYKADVSQLEKDLDDLVKAQQEIADTSKKASIEVQKSANAQQVAIKKRTELLELEKKKLENLRKQRQLAFSPEDIDKFNKEISESTRRIDLLSGKVEKVGNASNEAFDKITGGLTRIAGAFGVAFSLEAIIQFGQKSVEAFIEGEKYAQLLSDTVVGIGKQSEVAFEILNNQAERLESVSNQSAEAFKSAQIILTNYGLTASQVEQLLPSLLGFAKKTGDSIDGIAQKIGNALEGSGKQFKNLGANIDANKTPLENYNELLRALSVFQKDATLDATKLADAFQLQQNRLNELEAQIGERLVGAWQDAYGSVVQYIGAVSGLDVSSREAGAKASQLFSQEAQTRIDALKKEGKSTSDIIAFLRGDLDKANERLAKSNEILLNANEKYTGLFATLQKLSSPAYLAIAESSLNTARVVKANAQANVDAINTQILALNDQLDQDKRIIKSEELKQLKVEKLKELLLENQTINDLAGQTNVDNIEKELDLREKAKQKLEQLIDARKKLFEQLTGELQNLQKESELYQISLIEPKSFAEAVDKIEQLRDINKKYIDEDINLKIAQAKAQGLLTNDVADLFEKIRQGRKDLIDQKAGKEVLSLEETTIQKLAELKQKAQDLITQTNLGDLQKIVKKSGDAFEQAIVDVEAKIGTAQQKEAEDNLAKRLVLYQKSIISQRDADIQAIKDRATREAGSVKASATAEAERKLIFDNANKEIKALTDKAQDELDKANESYDETTDKLSQGVVDFVTANAQAFQLVGELLGELSNIYDQFAEKRIQQIEETKNAEISAIDEQIAKDQEALELRRISEEEAFQRKQSLEAQKVKLEEESAKKVREIKKRQAVLDKANALFQIALNTFQALSDVKNLTTAGSLTPLILALAGIQAAAVLAQPIPYRKGSKDTGASGHMARVGEEGEEIVYMPSHSKVLPARQTKEYGNLLDAMFDNKLNSYVAKTYVTPALQRQKAIFENEKQESFANNISKSIYFNGGLNANDLEKVRKKGQAITNVDELAKAIVKNLPTHDPYRR